MKLEAKFIRRGDVILIDGERLTVKSVRSRKSDGSVNVFWNGYLPERFDGDHLFEVEKRDTLATAYGPRRSSRG